MKCICGYQARDENDLDEHIIEMAKVDPPGKHHPAR